MRLNPDCIRDILLVCEDGCSPGEMYMFRYEPFEWDGRSYSADETLYHLRQCDMNGYFSKASEDMVGNFRVFDLSPRGHEFLADIRSDNVWNKTKAASKEIGVSSLRGLASIAAQIVTAIINKYIGV